MTMAVSAFLIVVAIAAPAVVLRLARTSTFVRKLSPVVVCYLVGITLGNQPWVRFSNDLAMTISTVAVALALPMLLFSVHFVAWFRLAGTTLLGFVFAVLAAFGGGTLAYFIFDGRVAEGAKSAGMLAAVYIGSTANMNAVGLALGAKPATFMALNVSDMMMSLAYLIFLMSLAGPLYAKFLPPFPYPKGATPNNAAAWDPYSETLPPLRQLLPSIGLAVLIVAICGAVSFLIPQSARDNVSILAITTLAIAASFVPQVRRFRGTQYMGQYLMLVFFTCIGAASDLSTLIRSWMVFLFTVVVITTSILIHLLLCTLFRIDRDTTIITSTATIFSPPFVPPVALALKNKEIMVSGITSGLVGYAVANYAGVALAWLLS